MNTYSNPKTLVPGAYWYMVPGKEPAICVKREGEAFVRFTNGGRQDWVRDGESFVGPLVAPLMTVDSADAMRSAFEAKYLRDWNDPAGDDMKAVWADAWTAARASA